MENYIKRLEEDARKLERKFASSSFSKKKEILLDIGDIVDLLDLSGRDPNYIHFDKKMADRYFRKPVLDIIDHTKDFASLSDQVIEKFKAMDFYCYERFMKLNLCAQDKLDILYEFLEYFNEDILKIYKDMYDNRKLFVSSDEDVEGHAFMLNTISDYYIMLSDAHMNDLLEIETMAHELSHIYSAKFLKNYSRKLYEYLSLGLFSETTTLFTELSFYNFLEERRILNNDFLLNRNLEDYNVLIFFKTMKYINEINNRKQCGINIDCYNYEIIGEEKNMELEIDKGIPFFEYTSRFYSGNLIDYNYAMSSIDAFNLHERELNGENTRDIVNEYLLSLNPRMLDDRLNNPKIDFMCDNISKRLTKLKTKYPL